YNLFLVLINILIKYLRKYINLVFINYPTLIKVKYTFNIRLNYYIVIINLLKFLKITLGVGEKYILLKY
ncbi:hypothetical protein M431DRAFT_102451, partial [Trichoderma harzianum CBS 226.95]